MIFKELKHSMRIISLQVENNNKKDVNYKRETDILELKSIVTTENVTKGACIHFLGPL